VSFAIEQGVVTTTMEVLRDAYGAGKLGVHVVANIHKALLGLGLAHYPPELPTYQEYPVRIYKMGSPVADVIDAVLEPTAAHDEELRQLLQNGQGAVEILDQIRELVCIK
jgi:hypothetical protein